MSRNIMKQQKNVHRTTRKCGSRGLYVESHLFSPCLCLLEPQSLDWSSSGLEDRIGTLGLRPAWLGQISDVFNQIPSLDKTIRGSLKERLHGVKSLLQLPREWSFLSSKIAVLWSVITPLGSDFLSVSDSLRWIRVWLLVEFQKYFWNLILVDTKDDIFQLDFIVQTWYLSALGSLFQ